MLLWIIAPKSLKILSSHADFRLDILHSKTLLYYFWGYENGLKADKVFKLTFEYLFTLYFYRFTYIAYEHTLSYIR